MLLLGSWQLSSQTPSCVTSVQASFASLTARLASCLGPACVEEELEPRLNAIQARAAALVVADVQATLGRADKLLFAVAAAGSLLRCQGSLPAAEWDVLAQPSQPVHIEQVCAHLLHSAVCVAARA